MLRITVLRDVQAATFKMEGKLTDEWVAEAEKAWTAFSSVPNQDRIVVDLCGVSFVDDCGRELLARMHSSGAKLVGAGPMTSALIEEVCQGKGAPNRKWLRSVLSLLFLLLLAGTMPGTSGCFNCQRNLLSKQARSAIQERIVPIHPSAWSIFSR